MTSRASVLLRGPQVLTIVAATLSLALTAQVGASMNTRTLSPEMVLRIAPGDAGSLARQAASLVQNHKDGRSLDAARALAARALAKEPTQIIAIRAAALASAQRGDIAQAGKVFAYGDRLTKRDLITHIWFIEANAAEGDIAGALRHYDLALRTSRAAGSQLLPVLANAASDPAIADQLATILVSRPPWAPGFYKTLLEQRVPPETVFSFMQRLRARHMALPPEIIDQAVTNLASADRSDLAWSLYRATVPNESAALLRNGGFDRLDRSVPFEWRYAQEGAVTANRESDGKTFTLAFRAEGGATGEIARQLLALTPGIYQLNAAVTLDDPGKMHLEWQVTCIRQQQALTQFPASNAAAAFQVPADGCPQQWLTLKLVETSDVAVGGRVANVRLRAQPTS